MKSLSAVGDAKIYIDRIKKSNISLKTNTNNLKESYIQLNQKYNKLKVNH